jgi:hypothetical protein
MPERPRAAAECGAIPFDGVRYAKCAMQHSSVERGAIARLSAGYDASLALVALGLGAYSIDARLFGRKGVRIPPPVPPDEG